MKIFSKIKNLILIALVLILPFANAKAASNELSYSPDDNSIYLYVEWFYKDFNHKFAFSPHKANLKISPIKNAPAPSRTEFAYPGDYIVKFTFPKFEKVGTYEYEVYLTNDSTETENNENIIYDQSKYLIRFYVQNSDGKQITSAVAFDKSTANEDGAGKVNKLSFRNIDPHVHDRNGNIIDPSDKNHPFNPRYPYDPFNPANPYNPYNPDKPNLPWDPKNEDRNKTNTPIYDTEVDGGAAFPWDDQEPINTDDLPKPIKPAKPTPPPKPSDDDNAIPFPWWPWDPSPEPTDPTRPIDPSTPEQPSNPTNPEVPNGTGTEKPWWWDTILPDTPFDPKNPIVDPSDPTNPTKPVDKKDPFIPWWWDILYPDEVFDPDNPNKPIEPKPDTGYEKPWWWDQLFPNHPFDPDNPSPPDDKDDSDEDDAESTRDSDDDGSADKENEKPSSDNDLDGSEGEDNPSTGEDDIDDSDSSDAIKSDEDDEDSDMADDADYDATREIPSTTDSDDSKSGPDKKGRDNVQTGIESVAIWALILCIALGLYKLTTKAKNKA